jgi:hypothetical protein
MNLLKIMLATALVLDAALVMTTTAVATNSPAVAVGFNNDVTGTGSFSQAGASNTNAQ